MSAPRADGFLCRQAPGLVLFACLILATLYAVTAPPSAAEDEVTARTGGSAAALTALVVLVGAALILGAGLVGASPREDRGRVVPGWPERPIEFAPPTARRPSAESSAPPRIGAALSAPPEAGRAGLRLVHSDRAGLRGMGRRRRGIA